MTQKPMTKSTSWYLLCIISDFFSLQVPLEKAGANKENILREFDDLKF